MPNLIAIVGRPNVGKSTLFNRLTQTRHAIVSDEAGTTRDRQYGKCEWNGREFSVVDTGGWVVKSDDVFEEEIRKQVLIATEEADVVLFLVDITNGVTDWDMDVAKILRRTKLPVVLVANKTDNNSQLYYAAEFYSSVSATRIASVRQREAAPATCSTTCSRYSKPTPASRWRRAYRALRLSDDPMPARAAS